jgi:hypothetical protein
MTADPRDRHADGDALTLAHEDLQRPVEIGFVGHARLVGLDLDELLAALDERAVGDQPAQDRALFHRVGEARHDDLAGPSRRGVRTVRGDVRAGRLVDCRALAHSIRSSAAPRIVSASMPKWR